MTLLRNLYELVRTLFDPDRVVLFLAVTVVGEVAW